MMCLFTPKWCNKNLKKFKWFDIALVKLSTFFFAWFITVFFVDGPAWFEMWWLWLIIWVITGIIPAIRFFSKKKR